MPAYPDPYNPQQPQQPTSGQPYGDPYAPPQYGTPQYPGQPPYQGQPPYPGQPYPGGGYSVPVMPGPPTGQNNTLGLLAMIFGIVSIPLGFCCGIFGVAMGGAGIVLGILGLRKANQGQATNRGMALTGIICGAIGVIGWIILIAISASTGFFHINTTTP
jgi:hypothetical protein